MRRGRRRRVSSDTETIDHSTVRGGRFRPLSENDCHRIIDHAFEILDQIGVAEAPEWLQKLLCAQGHSYPSRVDCVFRDHRWRPPFKRQAAVTLPGFVEDRGLDIGNHYVHIGTGGAVQTLMLLLENTASPRSKTCMPLCVLLISAIMLTTASGCWLPGIYPAFDLDINTAFTCLKATGKPIGISFDSADHVSPVCQLFDLALQQESGFRRQPFCMAIIVHVVSPLKFAPEGVEIMRMAIANGMPLQICTAAQAGATSPASLAGALAQGLAESLAGLMVVHAFFQPTPAFAFMPFISDLRTGAMTGGGGEAAVANAAATQLLNMLELPSTVSAGMTDSKLADAQSGYEKGYSVALAAQAVANMINLSVGMLGSIMVASPESLVIDNDMCGAILRSVRGIDVEDDYLDLEATRRVVNGEGHFLGEPQTLALMKSEYRYPELGDRQSVSDWLDAGSESIWTRARNRVQQILDNPDNSHLSPAAERKIREQFNIRLTGDSK